METTNRESRTGLKFKFALFYLISVGIIVYLFSLFFRSNASSGMLSAARPVAAADGSTVDFAANLESVNTGYKRLKELDQEYAQQTTPGAANERLIFAENNVNKSLDSLAVMARSITDKKVALQLQNFVDAYRFALNDRSAMRVYKIAALTQGKNSSSNNNGQEAIQQMQTEITARDKRIAELQNQNYTLEQRVKTAANSAGTTAAAQQNTDALRATISDQEKKIINLTTVNAALEKQNAAYSKDAAVPKPIADNGASALKTQNALLEKQVASLTAEVRLAQVDCSLTRADASQIISSSKQRKVLLSDALVTLNGLSGTSDATIRKKVTDKMVKLNQVASTVRD